MRVAAIQHAIAWEDPAANFLHLEGWIAAAAGAGARLVCLAETYACGFSMNTAQVGEGEDGPSRRFLREQASRHGIWLAATIPLLAAGDDKPANTLIVAGPEGEEHRYRKIHTFTYAGESEHYRPGTERVTVEIEGLRISLFVCYDLRFADEFWAVAPSTDVYLVLANWPEARRRHWQALLEARAIENQAYVVGVNRVGEGGGLRYAGDSRIIAPDGEILAAAARGETLLLADLDPEVVRATRDALPFLRDRRAT